MAITFIVCAEGDMDLTGTHKVGSITITFDELVKKFGQPIWTNYTREEEPDTYCEWHVSIHDEDEDEYSEVAVYDWRLPSDLHPRQNTQWNVGARGFKDLSRLMKVLGMI